jgi:hypothetical protein
MQLREHAPEQLTELQPGLPLATHSTQSEVAPFWLMEPPEHASSPSQDTLHAEPEAQLMAPTQTCDPAQCT